MILPVTTLNWKSGSSRSKLDKPFWIFEASQLTLCITLESF
jgi:hypothetical protein